MRRHLVTILAWLVVAACALIVAARIIALSHPQAVLPDGWTPPPLVPTATAVPTSTTPAAAVSTASPRPTHTITTWTTITAPPGTAGEDGP